MSSTGSNKKGKKKGASPALPGAGGDAGSQGQPVTAEAIAQIIHDQVQAAMAPVVAQVASVQEEVTRVRDEAKQVPPPDKSGMISEFRKFLQEQEEQDSDKLSSFGDSDYESVDDDEVKSSAGGSSKADPTPSARDRERERRTSRRRGRRHSSRDDKSLSDRLGPDIWAHIKEYHPSAWRYVASISWRRARDGHEARRLAQIVDALMRSGKVTADDDGMEMALRTLASLAEANRHDLPALVEQMEWRPPEQAVGRGVLREAIKDMQRQESLLAKAKKDNNKNRRNRNGANKNGDAPPADNKNKDDKSGAGRRK